MPELLINLLIDLMIEHVNVPSTATKHRHGHATLTSSAIFRCLSPAIPYSKSHDHNFKLVYCDTQYGTNTVYGTMVYACRNP